MIAGEWTLASNAYHFRSDIKSSGKGLWLAIVYPSPHNKYAIWAERAWLLPESFPEGIDTLEEQQNYALLMWRMQ